MVVCSTVNVYWAASQPGPGHGRNRPQKSWKIHGARESRDPPGVNFPPPESKQSTSRQGAEHPVTFLGASFDTRLLSYLPVFSNKQGRITSFMISDGKSSKTIPANLARYVVGEMPL